MKYTLEYPIKSVEIPFDLMIKNLSDPCDRPSFINCYEGLLQPPATQVVLDFIENYKKEQGFNNTEFTYNVRWMDTIGEKYYTERVRYYFWGMDLSQEFIINYITKCQNRLEQLKTQRDNLYWFQFIKRSELEGEINLESWRIQEASDAQQIEHAYPSFRRDWYLDLYY